MIQKRYKCLALVPARSGSKRIKNKNIRKLGDHPLIAYTIVSAIKSGVFTSIIVSTDSYEIGKIAKYYGAEVPFLRPKKYASDASADIEWVKYTLERLSEESKSLESCFSILRPTSPFRKSETIQRAWKEFINDGKADSLRGIERCSEHPSKMWIIDKKGNRMKPVMENPDKSDTPWHSQQYVSLPKVYKQNASLEIAWTRLPLNHNSITGDIIMPFFTDDYEGYDINDEKDWVYAEYLIKHKKVRLPI